MGGGECGLFAPIHGDQRLMGLRGIPILLGRMGNRRSMAVVAGDTFELIKLSLGHRRECKEKSFVVISQPFSLCYSDLLWYVFLYLLFLCPL